jgi:hypothetical protein
MLALANISELQRKIREQEYTAAASCEQREIGSTRLSHKIYLVAIHIVIARH